MTKCKKCGSKHLEESSSIFVCVNCKEIYSQRTKLDALKKLHQLKEKNSAINAYNEAMEALQKKRTAENILKRSAVRGE